MWYIFNSGVAAFISLNTVLKAIDTDRSSLYNIYSLHYVQSALYHSPYVRLPPRAGSSSVTLHHWAYSLVVPVHTAPEADSLPCMVELC